MINYFIKGIVGLGVMWSAFTCYAYLSKYVATSNMFLSMYFCVVGMMLIAIAGVAVLYSAIHFLWVFDPPNEANEKS